MSCLSIVNENNNIDIIQLLIKYAIENNINLKKNHFVWNIPIIIIKYFFFKNTYSIFIYICIIFYFKKLLLLLLILLLLFYYTLIINAF